VKKLTNADIGILSNPFLTISGAGTRMSTETSGKYYADVQDVHAAGGISASPSRSEIAGMMSARTHKSVQPIVIIDSQLLSRECLARVINNDCGRPAFCFSSIDEWLAANPAVTASLVVLCQSRR